MCDVIFVVPMLDVNRLILLKLVEVCLRKALLLVELAQRVVAVSAEALHGLSVEEASLRLVGLSGETPLWAD